MGESFRVEPAELHAFADYMQSMVGDFGAIDSYVQAEGCNTAGFTGLLAVLQPVVQWVGQRYGDTLDFGRDRLDGASVGLHKAADNYERTDANRAAAADQMAGQIPGGS